MPDPLPSATSSSGPQTTTVSGPRRSSSAVESNFAATMMNNNLSSSEETPHRSSLWAGGALPRLHATRNYNFKDDMDVFSPLVDVQPITPSLDNLWKDQPGDRKTSPLFPSRKFMHSEGVSDVHPIFDWKPGPASKQV